MRKQSMRDTYPPSLDAFLAAPAEQIAAIAPETAIYAVGGTRRRAAMDGVPLDTNAYPTSTLAHLCETAALFFRLGVKNIILPSLGPRQYAEQGSYGKHLLGWISEHLLGPTMLARYRQHGWRVRALVPAAQSIPTFQEMAARAARETAEDGPTLLFYFVAESTEPWREILAGAAQGPIRTQQEAIQAFYGIDIAPASLLIGFGKPMLGNSLVPPLLVGGDLHCYWTQSAGFSLTEPMLRRILYDAAYSRTTWAADRSERYSAVARQHALWESDAIIGVGTRVGGFWYPEGFHGYAES
jgi:hypothetical protein